MPKKAYLAPHLSSNDLKQKYRTSTDTVESRQWHAASGKYLWAGQ